MKPMLAATLKETDLPNLKYPLYVSAKIDGIRCILKDGAALSRSLKPIPNNHIQEMLGKLKLEGDLDGELVVGAPFGNDVMQRTSSGVMTRDGIPDFTYFVFDYKNWSDRHTGYSERRDRLEGLEIIGKRELGERYQTLHSRVANSLREVIEFEEQCLMWGYEGVMLRNPDSVYKHGRSTLKEGALMKLKRFEDSEAIVISIKELMRNGNALEKDNLGYAKRSSRNDGMIPGETMGALGVRDIKTGIEFDIGTGFYAEMRKNIWKNQHNILKCANIVKYKYFPSGIKTAPRFPVFIGFRNPIDV